MEENDNQRQELQNFLQKTAESFKEVKTISVTCLQFGDTGKGKFVDLFANWADIIARGTGGDNAGHTVVCNGKSRVFHLIPSGITHDKNGKINVIGSGAVVYPKTLVDEINLLSSEGMTVDNLKVALNAKLILPCHIVLDRIHEAKAGEAKKIGTTGKGIGPAYSDFIGRRGLMVNDLLNPDLFRQKLDKALNYANQLLAECNRESIREIMFHEHLENGLYYHEQKYANDNFFFEMEKIVERYVEYGKLIFPYISDTDYLIRNSCGNKNILLEGAQGSMLDVDYGTYPYVTSSNCTPAGLAKGVGLKESDVDLTFGIIKGLYMTRVGKGPFPTEIGGAVSEGWCNGTGSRSQEKEMEVDSNDNDAFKQGVAIRINGGEYGATTGRPRRVGWLDLPLLRKSLEHGAKKIILTKLDVLSGVDMINVCYAYRYDGPDFYYGNIKLTQGLELERAIVLPEVLKYCIPLYHKFPGWQEDIRGLQNFDDLPNNLKDGLASVFANLSALPAIISTGPDRKETIFL